MACTWSVVSDFLGPRGLKPARLLCPWDFPGKNTGAGCHFLLQGVCLTQGSNPHLLHWQSDSSPRSHLGSPSLTQFTLKIEGHRRLAVLDGAALPLGHVKFVGIPWQRLSPK